MAQVTSPSGSSKLFRRLLSASAIAVGAAALLQAQIPGRNVNMVSGRTLPGGDPYLQRQNEPSIAASTRNPLHLLAGANDYRTVDIPGLPGDAETGDAWMGVFKSYDGGNTWRSTLIPGYPQDQPSNSPLKAYKAGADPVVRAGTNGLFYYSGLAFTRAVPATATTPAVPSTSALFVSRFIDNNNQEAGDPIVFIDTTLVQKNDGTAFIDKPWFAADIPRAGAQLCTITTQQPSPTPNEPNQVKTITQSFPGGVAYASYTLIVGEGDELRSQIYLSRSTDCGSTWSSPQQISSSLDPINQGATLAIDPRNGTVYLAWRRFTSDGTDDSIMVTRSRDQGQKWDPPGRARRFPRGKKVGLSSEMHGKKFKKPIELAELASLDQPTREDRFRTNAYPTMTVDAEGRVYVAWSERGFAPINDLEEGDARVVIASSTTGDTWTLPVTVDNTAVAGHQVMPTMAFAGGKLMIAYYDFRDDVSGVFRQFIDETSAVTFGNKRHTVDVRAAMALPGPITQFGASVRVSEYLMGNRPNRPPEAIEQLQFNPPNLKLFQLGTVPFVGDYIDIGASPAFVPTATGGWAYNTAPVSSPLFHAVWTDNRDVVPPANGDWKTYTPPTALGGTTPNSACVAGREGMRNQNIYTARITGGLVAGSPGNTKPLHPTLPRGFVIFAQNATEIARTFRLTIEHQPVEGKASFLQDSVLPPVAPATSAPPLVTTLDVTVPRRSTIARNMYAISSNPDAQIHVSVKEIGVAGGAEIPEGLQDTVILNPDISNPDISNPDISNPDISNPDISNAEVSNPDISNPDISNPDISNPDISNPDISNPDISNVQVANPDISNPDISNPDISNPDISNPDISNPDISNPDISNPDISNQSLTDTTWTLTNEGNTTTSFSVKLLLNGAQPSPSQIVVQLILHKVYTTPVAIACTLLNQPHNQLLANITNPVFTDPQDLTDPDITNASPSNATLWLAPGERAKITLRVMDKDIHDNITFNAATQITPAVVSQAVDVSGFVSGGIVIGTEEPVSLPPTDNVQVQFGNLEPTYPSGAAVGLITVSVRDDSAAPLFGATVAMSVLTVPDDVQVTPTATSLTNANGQAGFNVPVLAPGSYYVKARVTSVAYPELFANSSTFSVVAPAVMGTTYTVTNTADDGIGSLRRALVLSNSSVGMTDTIRFNIPGTGPHVLNLATRLPRLIDAAVIDATTAGACGPDAPLVELSPALPAFAGPGLLVTAGGTTIRGVAVTGFTGNGVEFRGGGGNRLECSYLEGNTSNGIQIIDSAANVIGGVDALARNVISGNTGEGVRIDGAASTGNVVQGNYIGTDATGTADLGNGASGVYVRRAPANSILRNTVSGNNGFAGIAVCGATAFCGGGDFGTLTSNASGNVIRGNIVGTNADGANLGNAGFGISLDSVTNTVVGGELSGEANAIAFNSVGVRIFGTDATGNRLVRNSIRDSVGLGIDLGVAGVTANDGTDLDTGPNGLQNFPVITSAVNQSGGATTVQGTLQSAPGTAFVIELFAGSACDGSGNGEGPSWFGTVSGVSTNTDGVLTFSSTIAPGIAAGFVLTATATDPTGNTSEFSTCTTVQPPPAAVVSGPVQWTGNGSFYEYVRVNGISWTDASAAAAARTHSGRTGRLATITSAEENQFVNSLKGTGDMRAWIGLYDPDGTGGRTFEWITPEAVSYTNWNNPNAPLEQDREPNNLTTEFWVEIFGDATWNNNLNLNSAILGYIVEYPAPVLTDGGGGPSASPVPPLRQP